MSKFDEPWEFREGYRLAILDSRREVVVTDGSADAECPPVADAEVLTRIVACVNFCAGIPTPILDAFLAKKIGAATLAELVRCHERSAGDEQCPECGIEAPGHVRSCVYKLAADVMRDSNWSPVVAIETEYPKRAGT